MSSGGRSGGFSGSHAGAPAYSGGGRFSGPWSSAPAYSGGGFSGSRGAPAYSGGRFSGAQSPAYGGGGFSGSRPSAPTFNGGRFISPRPSAPAYNGDRFGSTRAPAYSGSRFTSTRPGAPAYNGSRFVAAPGGRYGYYTSGHNYGSPRFDNRPGGDHRFAGRTGFNHIPYGGHPRYWAGGNFHGIYWPRAHYHTGFVQFVAVLPAFYSTFWWGGIPYYYWDDTYYTWSQPDYGYVATDPPPVVDDGDTSDAGSAVPQSSDASSLYIYPKNGQSEEQTSTDRYECHQWAASQTGFDPTNGADQPAGSSGPDDYRRAMMACLDARGYSAR
jgi:hypothetical protein